MSQLYKSNPFFDRGRLPAFNQIDVKKHTNEAVRMQLDKQIAEFDQFELDISNTLNPTYTNTLELLEKQGFGLSRTYGIIYHLSGVADNDDIRDVKKHYIGELSEFNDRISNSVPLFDALCRIDITSDNVCPMEKRVVQMQIDGMRQNGFGLPDEKRCDLLRISKRLTELSIQYSENATDSAKAVYKIPTTMNQMIESCPKFAYDQWIVSTATDSTATDSTATKYAIGMNGPSVSDALQYIPDQSIRRGIYMQYITRAGEANYPIINEILTLRQERAEILGFDNHTEYVLLDKMVSSPTELDEFYKDKYTKYATSAQLEIDELDKFANKKLNPWDMAYYGNLKNRHDFGYTDEDTKPYFQLDPVLINLHKLCNELFGIKFIEIEKTDPQFPETWHPDVRFFEIYDEKGQHRSSLYFDPYVRPGIKRGGAWMCGAVDRSRAIPENELPVAYIVCNQSPPICPVNGNPDDPLISLMTASEVITLYHETGHAINHMLTDIRIGNVSGVPSEWDAVEIQSQALELFATHIDSLEQAVHYQTGESIPSKMVDYIIDSTKDKGASQCRQIYFGNLDLELHRNWKQITAKGETIWDVQRRIYEKYMKHGIYEPTNRFLSTFSHIFAGGYSSSYYGYMYSKEYSKQIYTKITEVSGDERRRRGRHLLDTVYALGSSEPMCDILNKFFKKFE